MTDPRSYDAAIADRASRGDEPTMVQAPDLMNRLRQRVTDHAVAAAKSRRDRDDILAEKIRIKAYQILNVIDLTGSGDRSPHTGAYVIEYKPRLSGMEDVTWFATIVDGNTDNQNFTTRPVATLHALARQAGNPDDHGVTARVTARALGFPDN